MQDLTSEASADVSTKKTVVLIPTYNEKGNIEQLIKNIFHIVPEIYVIVVDDNSADGTGYAVESLKAKYKNLNIIHRQNNRGYGLALKEAFKKAMDDNFSLVLTMDADLSHNPEIIPKLIEKNQRFSVTIGSRYVEGGKIEVDWGMFRRSVSRLGSTYARLMLAMPIKDCTSGFRGYQIDILRKINFRDIKSNGYSFLIETLYMCKKNGSSFCEVPIIYVDRVRGKSKLSRKIVFEAFFKVSKMGLLRIFNKN